MAEHDYEVICGNIGSVYRGRVWTLALVTYKDYCQLSIRDVGRAAGETVTILRDGEIHRQYIGTLEREQCYD